MHGHMEVQSCRRVHRQLYGLLRKLCLGGCLTAAASLDLGLTGRSPMRSKAKMDGLGMSSSSIADGYGSSNRGRTASSCLLTSFRGGCMRPISNSAA